MSENLACGKLLELQYLVEIALSPQEITRAHSNPREILKNCIDNLKIMTPMREIEGVRTAYDAYFP